MIKLSTGVDATLGNYLKLATVVFGKESKAVKFLEEKISKDRENDEVIAPESQMVYLLGQIHLGKGE